MPRFSLVSGEAEGTTTSKTLGPLWTNSILHHRSDTQVSEDSLQNTNQEWLQPWLLLWLRSGAGVRPSTDVDTHTCKLEATRDCGISQLGVHWHCTLIQFQCHLPILQVSGCFVKSYLALRNKARPKAIQRTRRVGCGHM